MALMKTLILALCIGHSAVLELPPRRRARLFSYMWCWVLLGHFPSLRPVVDLWGRETFCSRVGVKVAGRPKRASTTMLDTCMERIETCDSATWSSLPVPKSEAKEERVLLLVYLLVEVHVVDPSIIVLLGSEGARKYKCSPSKKKSFSGFLFWELDFYD